MPGDEPVLFVALRAVHLVGPGSLGIVGGRREELAHGVDRHLRRDLARRVAAHSVGDDVEAVLAEDGEVVLVVVALLADVRFAGDFDAERFSHGLPGEVIHGTAEGGQAHGIR